MASSQREVTLDDSQPFFKSRLETTRQGMKYPGIPEGTSPDHDPITPGLLNHPLRQKRSGYISVSDDGNPNHALHFPDQIPIRLVDVSIRDAVKVAAELNIYAYDAYLIVCAQDQRVGLLSLDKALLVAAKQAGVSALEVP